MMVRNFAGLLMGAITKPIVARWEALTTKSVAVKEIISFCLQLRFRRDEFISISLIVVHINDANSNLGVHYFLVEEISMLLSS